MTELNSPPPDDAPLAERKRYAREVLSVGRQVYDPAIVAYGKALMAAVRREVKKIGLGQHPRRGGGYQAKAANDPHG